jgi:anaerobic selenocysteine-containing dehydrogenase
MPESSRRRVPAFCALCVSRCGCEAVIEGDRLVAIEPDPSHPSGRALCAKGRASPELVEARDRLLYPLRRTRPKGDRDPGWQRISWEEALDETAAAYADIVLPVASAWEREGLRVGFGLDQDACELVQLRSAIVAPRGEARADIEIVFDLAVRLGLGNQFWDGDIEAALSHHLAPSGLTPAMLRTAPRGIRVPLEPRFQKYRQDGFATPSGKVEIFSAALQEIGEAPLPEFRAPTSDPRFPLALTSAKTPLYCHSQHRNLPRLRRFAPDPIAEMSPATADARGIGNGDWIVIATPRGRVRARARFNGTLGDGIVAAQHGWWQACPELGLPGYDGSPIRCRICPYFLAESVDKRGLADGRFARRPVLKPPRYRIAVCNPSLLTDFTRQPANRCLTPRRTGSGWDRCFQGRSVCLRQPELGRGPPTQLAPDLHSAAGLSGKALDHRQAEAGSSPQFLGRKERFECSR